MLLQELTQQSDFVKIDPPQCVKTRGLINGKKNVVLNVSVIYPHTYRFMSKDLYKATINGYNRFNVY